MAMTDSSHGAQASINVTPLIDVLLVLLIIFMVIQPTVQRGLHALVPQPPEARNVDPNPRTLVLSVDGTPDHPAYAINGEPVRFGDLRPTLQRLVQQGGRNTLFVQASAALDYGSVAPVLGFATDAGADTVSLLTPSTLGH